MHTTLNPATRYIELQNWLHHSLPNSFHHIERLAGDASFRTYYRIHLNDTTLIAMDAPPHLEDSHPFVAIAKQLKEAQLIVPDVIAQDLSQGFLLLTDFGDNLLNKAAKTDNAISLYKTAIDELIKLQRCAQKNEHWHFAPFDEALFYQELSRFEEWYLVNHLNLSLSKVEKKLLQKYFRLLIDNALTQTQLCVHRDYHSRNLLVLPEDQIGIIDFQDAVWGPVTYDLVSLIRDCYVAWPHEYLSQWINHYHQSAHDTKILTNISRDQLQHWLDWMGIQRHLKAIYIFARKYRRDNSTAYLGDIPRTMNYILDVSTHYSQFNDLRDFLSNLPASTL